MSSPLKWQQAASGVLSILALLISIATFFFSDAYYNHSLFLVVAPSDGQPPGPDLDMKDVMFPPQFSATVVLVNTGNQSETVLSVALTYQISGGSGHPGWVSWNPTLQTPIVLAAGDAQLVPVSTNAEAITHTPDFESPNWVSAAIEATFIETDGSIKTVYGQFGKLQLIENGQSPPALVLMRTTLTPRFTLIEHNTFDAWESWGFDLWRRLKSRISKP